MHKELDPTGPAATKLRNTKHVLDDAIEHFLQVGYFRMPAWEGELIMKSDNVRKFAREVAKEMRRPFVCIYDAYRWRRFATGNPEKPYEYQSTLGLGIDIPLRKYTMPLVHPLLMAGATSESRDAPIWYVPHRPFTKLWQFKIFDEDFAREYMKMFRERDEFREALRLPPKVTELKKAA